MSEKIVFLKFRSNDTSAEGINFIACKACRNKTYILIEDKVDAFPMLKCAACGAHIGRIGWAE
jgi:hypothetical protein